MSDCLITYNGNKYTDEEFKKYLMDNGITEDQLVREKELIDRAASLAANVKGIYKDAFPDNVRQSLFEAAAQANSSAGEKRGAIKTFGKEVVKIAQELFPSAKSGDIYLQTEGTEPKPASAKVIAKLKEFNDRIGVKPEYVDAIIVNGKKLNANGLTDAYKGLLQIVNGKEDVAFPEESMHLAVEIIQHTSSPLFTALMTDINKYPELQQTMTDYRGNKFYQTPEGKPDILKLKKEAIAKVLAKVVSRVIDDTDNKENIAKTRSLWQRIVDWLKKLFSKAAFDPFEEVAKKVENNEDFGTVKDIKEGMEYNDSKDIFLQVNQDETYNKIDSVAKTISKNGQEYTVNGKKVNHTIDERVDNDLQRKFKSPSEYFANREAFRKESEGKIVNEISNIANRYIDDAGLVRTDEPTSPLTSVIDPYDLTFAQTLDSWFSDKVDSYPALTKFIINKPIYNSVTDTAGFANFIAITPEGKVDINQFKLLTLGKKDSDISQNLQGSYNIEIQGLRDILSKSYAINKDDFRETRAIPIKASYTQDKADNKFVLNSIKIGNVNVELEQDPTLYPVPSLSESTGNKTLDTLIRTFKNSALALEKQKPLPGQELIKKQRVAELFAAIRVLQVKKQAADLIKSAKNVTDYEENRIPTLDKKIKETDPLIAKEVGLSKLLDEIHISQSRLTPYATLGDSMRTIYGPKDKDGYTESAKVIANSAQGSIGDLNVMEDYVRTNLYSKISNVVDELKPEKKLNWTKKTFLGISRGNIKSQQQMWHLVERNENFYKLRYAKLINELNTIRKDIEKAKITEDDVRSKVLEHDDKGNWTGKAVQKIDKGFFNTINKGIKTKDVTLIKRSIDLDAYKVWYNSQLEGIEDYAKHANLSEGDEANNKAKQFLVENWKTSHNIDAKSGINPANRGLFLFPKEEIWESAAYKELKKPENASLMRLHSFLGDLVNRANDAGMFEGMAAAKYGFFPHLMKGFIEKLNSEGGFKDGYIAPWRDLQTVPEGQAYGEYDPVSNEPINSIRAHYARDLGKRVQNMDGSYFTDYSNVSQQVVKAIYMFAGDVVKYELKSETEPLFNMIVNTEGRKSILRGTKTKEGDIQLAPNVDNLEAIVKYRDYYMYDKLIQGSDATFDLNIGKPIKTINRLMGRKILIEPENDVVTLSGIRVIQRISRFFNNKTMALSFWGPISNLFGGTTNAFINSGDFFSKTDLAKSFLNIADTINEGVSEEGKKRYALIHYFIPENIDEQRNRSRNFSDYKAEKYLSMEHLHILMRESDELVNNTFALAFFDNTLLQDGKLINIIDKVRTENNYSSRYDLPLEERKSLEDKISKEIENLKSNSPDLLIKKIKLDAHGHVIDPVNEEEFSRYRSTIINFSKEILGNMSPADLALYRTHVFGAAFMMFKNWIPELLYKRLGALEYNPGSKSYTYGRTRSLVSHVVHFGLGGTASILKALGGNKESFIREAKEDYERLKQRAADRGEEFNMDFGTFMDLKLKTVTSGFKEIILALGVLGLYYFIKSIQQNDKEKDHVEQGIFKYTLQGIDKLQDEISFFYNPTSFTSIVNGNVFPAISLATDAERLLKNLATLGYDTIVGDEEDAKKQHIMKYIYKDVPVLKQWMTWQAIWSEKFAKDNGIIIQTQSGGH